MKVSWDKKTSKEKGKREFPELRTGGRLEETACQRSSAMPRPYPRLTPDLRTACYRSCFSAQEECGDLDTLHGTAPMTRESRQERLSPGAICATVTYVSLQGEKGDMRPSGLSPTELPLRSSHCIREGHTTHSCTSTRAAPRLWQLSMYKELRWAPEPETDVSPFLMGPQSSGEMANTQTDK